MLTNYRTLKQNEKEKLIAQKRELKRELQLQLSLCTSDAQEERLGDLIDRLDEEIKILEKE